jgi:hypothetical protein
MLVHHMLGISHPLDGKFHESFIQSIHPNSQKEVLKHKHKAPGNVPSLQDDNGPN